MLYAQFAGSVSLRDIEAGLSSHANRLYHIHATAPRSGPLWVKARETARSRAFPIC